MLQDRFDFKHLVIIVYDEQTCNSWVFIFLTACWFYVSVSCIMTQLKWRFILMKLPLVRRAYISLYITATHKKHQNDFDDKYSIHHVSINLFIFSSSLSSSPAHNPSTNSQIRYFLCAPSIFHRRHCFVMPHHKSFWRLSPLSLILATMYCRRSS